MASTGAVCYVRPQSIAGASAGHSTGAVSFFSVRAVSGLWSTVGVQASADTRGALTWLPRESEPLGIVNKDGTVRISPYWYRFFNTVANVKLGGIDGDTLPDVSATVTATIETAAAAEAQVSVLAQQTQTNAESLYVVRNVVKQASLAGSDQIPEVGL